MATGQAINRTNVDLPVELSREIIQKATDTSAIMSLARQITLPGRGEAINVITGDPEAAWVGETAAKIRKLRVPDVYKGKGIKYANEHLRVKEGKTGAKK